MKLSVDFKKPQRPVGELNGTNNGPLLVFTDRSAEYRDMGVKFVRFHETHSIETNCIEIPFIFRDNDKDETKPENYYFGATDAVIRAAHDEGIEIMYRLGMGTEATFPRRFLFVPDDYMKWARIAEHIIMHYNEGWANGFHSGIKYWEIWNEADLIEYWPGKRMEYINFYSQVSNYLKKRFPDILIGPSGFADLYEYDERYIEDKKNNRSRIKFFDELMRRYTAGEYPMDFFPWHIYARTSKKTAARCRIIRDLLTRHGVYGKIEVINTEWNQMSLRRDPGAPWGGWDFYQIIDQAHGVALLNSMIIMQKNGVTKAAYYRPDESSRFCGLFDFDGSKKNHYYVFKAFNMLKQAKTEVETQGGDEQVQICAATDGKQGVLIIGNEGERGRRIELSVKGLSDLACSRYVYSEKEKLKKHADRLKPCFVIPGATAFIYTFGQEDEV